MPNKTRSDLEYHKKDNLQKIGGCFKIRAEGRMKEPTHDIAIYDGILIVELIFVISELDSQLFFDRRLCS